MAFAGIGVIITEVVSPIPFPESIMRPSLLPIALPILIVSLCPLATTTALAQGKTSLPSLDAMVMARDGKTLIVSVPSAGQLVYFDTMTEKELKKMEVEFQPGALALQANKLFAASKGSPTIHVLDVETGKKLSEIKLPGEAVEKLACHPTSGMVYATNAAMDIYAIEPGSGKFNKTKAAGKQIMIDPSDGTMVYTSIYNPAKDKVIVQEMPGKTFKVELVKGKANNVVMKFKADGAELKFQGGNPNAGSGGSWFSVSRDGKVYAMSGPYRSPQQKGITFNIGIFETGEMTTLVGQLQHEGFPRAICFHPQLDVVATVVEGPLGGITVFNSKSQVKKQSFKVPSLTKLPHTLIFGAEGTKLIAAHTMIPTGGREASVTLAFHALSLTDEQKELLKKGSAK